VSSIAKKFIFYSICLNFFLAKIFSLYQNSSVLMAEGGNSLKGRLELSHVEAKMIRKFESRQVKTGGFSFGSNRVSFLTFTVLLSCALLLVFAGCESLEMKAAEAERVRKLPIEARKAQLQQSLESRFENPVAHFELAQLYHSEGSWSKAEYHYNIAMSFDPANADAKASMVKLFLDSGDTAKAKNYAGTYVNQANSSDIESLRLAMAFEKQQLDEYALTCYQQALNLAPESAKINKQMAYYYLGKDDKDRAKEYFVRSFQLDPRQPEVAGELGRLGVEVKIPSQAGTGAKDETAQPPAEKKLQMVMRHGRVQFEPVDNTSEKKE
jgi:tetratricopeptide (TPR) repeat protein